MEFVTYHTFFISRLSIQDLSQQYVVGLLAFGGGFHVRMWGQTKDPGINNADIAFQICNNAKSPVFRLGFPLV
jgi:hypothetical protein